MPKFGTQQSGASVEMHHLMCYFYKTGAQNYPTGKELIMGIYLNPGNENFRRALNADIYVDKTMMLDVLNRFIDKGNNYICVSRPRRFGKTIAQNMIAAYYSKGCDSKELFKDLLISTVPEYESRMNRFNVIKIDLNGEYETSEDKDFVISDLLEKLKEDLRDEFPDLTFRNRATVADMMLRVYAKTGETFIVLIDEYDVLVRENVSQKLFREYIGFLNGLFKNDTLRPAISLAYITGILPVVRDKVQSKLNNFKEYTIMDAKELAPFTGFTSDEVEGLCAKYHVDYEECRLWYDGYRQHGLEIYNPESVIESVSSGRFDDYWGKTSTYTVISDRINANFEGMKDDIIRMLSGENTGVRVNRFMNTMKDFKNKDDAFTYLIHTGYLAYNSEDRSCRIPNREIRQEWFFAIEDNSEYKTTDRIIKASKELLKETFSGNEKAVANALDASHINVTSNRSYNNEDALQSAIYLAYIYALNKYTVTKEMTAGKGFADLTYIPVKRESGPAMIIELKRNDSTESALDQIRDRQYFKSLDHYQGNLLLVGINYDENSKTHTCRIEKFRKD